MCAVVPVWKEMARGIQNRSKYIGVNQVHSMAVVKTRYKNNNSNNNNNNNNNYTFGGGNISEARPSDWKTKAQYWRRFESPVRQGIFLSEQTLLRCPCSHRVQSHALKYMRTSKQQQQQKPEAAIPLFGHTKILHTLIGMRLLCLTQVVPP